MPRSAGCGLHVAALVAVSVAGLADAAFPCAPAPRPGESVDIVGEDAIIVWYPAERVQHFVRRATFSTSEVADFGFLVPSPSAPTLAEAPDSVFDALEAAIRPEVVTRTRTVLEPTLPMAVVASVMAPRLGNLHEHAREELHGVQAL